MGLSDFSDSSCLKGGKIWRKKNIYIYILAKLNSSPFLTYRLHVHAHLQSLQPAVLSARTLIFLSPPVLPPTNRLIFPLGLSQVLTHLFQECFLHPQGWLYGPSMFFHSCWCPPHCELPHWTTKHLYLSSSLFVSAM